MSNPRDIGCQHLQRGSQRHGNTLPLCNPHGNAGSAKSADHKKNLVELGEIEPASASVQRTVLHV